MILKRTVLTIVLLTLLMTGALGCSEDHENDDRISDGTTVVTEAETIENETVVDQETTDIPIEHDDPIEDQTDTSDDDEASESDASDGSVDTVSLASHGGYYRVVLDYAREQDSYAMGAAYGAVLVEKVPGIRAALDSFVETLIVKNTDMYIEDMGLDIPEAFKSMAVGVIAEMLYARIPDIEPQIPAEYLEELEGLASVLCDAGNDYLGDGMLSKNELYFTHIMGAIARTVQCSATGIEPTASATGNVLAGRGFDLEAGMAGYGSITELRYPDRSVYLIGWLGNLTAFTGFNDSGLFGAVVDTTGSGEPYTSTGIHSYAYDLRLALDETSEVDSAAALLQTNAYGFNHLIFLADPDKTGILENNISGTGSNMRREMRYADSELMAGITWPYDDIVIAVSAFMLKGNHDNFTESIIATSRFDSYTMLLDEMMGDGSITWEELEALHSYDGTDGVPSAMEFGDIYNDGTRYIVLFEPATLALRVWFTPSDMPPDDPALFETVTVNP